MKDNLKNQNGSSNYTVLIVEDEEINYLYIEMLLQKYEHDITSLHAKDGKEAVDICKENSNIDLVLMDLKMPIMNGFEATTLIKQLNPNIPVVAQTAYTTDDKKAEAFDAGCDDFISKPISVGILNSVMDKYLKFKK